MRDLPQLIESMLLFVPQEEKAIIEKLKNVQQSALFSAPELMPIRWSSLQEVLMEFLSEFNSETPEWKIIIASLFSATPYSSIKSALKCPNPAATQIASPQPVSMTE